MVFIDFYWFPLSELTVAQPPCLPEVPFNRVLKRIPDPVLGTRFGGFCEWYLRFGCPKHDPGAARDRLISVCLCV